MAGEGLDDRVERLERRLDDLQVGVELLIGSLPDPTKDELRAALEPLSRRVRAERPRAGQPWPDEGLRRAAAALSLIEDGL